MSVIVVKIGGVDRTSLIEKRTIRFTNVLTRRTDTAAFRLVDPPDTAAEPKAGQEVEILENSVKRFAGIISSSDRNAINRTIDSFEVKAQDFSKLLDKRLVNRVFNTPTLGGDIIKTIITDFVKDASVTTTNVLDGPTIDFIGFNFRPALEAISEIAKVSAFDWFIDEDKDIHFFPKETATAPFEINTSELRYRKLKIRPVASQLRNRVTVRGGTQDSDLFTEDKKGDGDRRTFPVSYPPTATPVVRVNGVSKTVGIKNVDDETAFDFVFDEDEKVVENASQATLSSTDKLTFVYKFEIPILIQVEDPDSQAGIGALEGNDGVYEFAIEDRDLGTLASARDRARAEITRFGNIVTKGSFETHLSGFRSGQLLTINLPLKGFNSETFLIQKVTTRSQGSGTLFSTVEFGSFSFVLEDFLLDLFRQGRKIAIRKGEILDDLVSATEAIPVVDEAVTFTQKTPPFTWSPGANDAVWNEAQWS